MKVLVVGGGLAGLAASLSLAERGFQVWLLEKSRGLGGRAGSFVHPRTGEVVDFSQHILLHCCTALLDFYDRLGVRERVFFYPRIPFIDGKGNVSFLGASSGLAKHLPPPFHLLPSLLSLPFLSIGEKISLGKAFWNLGSVKNGISPGWVPKPLPGWAFSSWLSKQKQGEGVIGRFWKPVLVSALNEELEKISFPYAAFVMREGFLKSRDGYEVGVSALPLRDLYQPALQILERGGGGILTGAEVTRVVMDQREMSSDTEKDRGAENGKASGRRVEGVQLRDGRILHGEHLVLAVPPRAIPELLNGTGIEGEFRCPGKLESSPIVTAHLWFKEAVSDLPFACLLDRTIHWIFQRPLAPGGAALPNQPAPDDAALPRGTVGGGAHLQCIVSAARSLVKMKKEEIVRICMRELGEIFPKAREENLLDAFVTKGRDATFSPTPGSDEIRPPQQTSISNLFLAGDWTSTGWPSTMEGAVRSGYLAAEALAAEAFTSGCALGALFPDALPREAIS